MPQYGDLYGATRYNYPAYPTYSRYSHLYKPHLTTISEISLPYRRLNAPKLYLPSTRPQRPIKVIDTADIDVSSGRYKKFERRSKPQEARPSERVSRDRGTVRLRTLHPDRLRQQISGKTLGQLLKEKFLIRSRSKEKAFARSASFRDICDAITSEGVEAELNPGQPEAVRRRQSRGDLLDDIRRASRELSPEDLRVLNSILAAEGSDSGDSSDDEFTLYRVEREPRGVVEAEASKCAAECSAQTEQYPSRYPDGSLLIESLEGSESVAVDERIEAGDCVGERIGEEGKVVNKSIENVKSFQEVKAVCKPIEEVKASSKQIEEVKTAGKQIEEVKASGKQIEEVKATSKQIEEVKASGKQFVEVKASAKPIEEVKAVGKQTEEVKAAGKQFVEVKDSGKQIEKVKSVDIPIKEVKAVGKQIENIKTSGKQFEEVKTIGRQFVTSEASESKQIEERINRIHPTVQLTEEKPIEQAKKLVGNKTIKPSKEEESKPEEIPTVLADDNKATNQIVDETEAPKDISNVEIEEIKFKFKPKITSTSSIEEPPSPKRTLVAVVDEVEVQTPPKDKEKKLKLNVCVSIELAKKEPKPKRVDQGVFAPPAARRPLLHRLLAGRPPAHQHQQLRELQKTKKKKKKRSPKVTSKRSLLQKPMKDDPDLSVFVPPEEPPAEAPAQAEPAFVPLQSNRLSQWMHPWSKPEQYDECPVEIYARPKVIKGRHYPRGRKNRHQQQQQQPQGPADSDDATTTTTEEEDDEEEDEEEATSVSLKSNDSGFGSTIPEKLNAQPENRVGQVCDRDELDVEDFLTDLRKCGKIIPPATTIPRFKKYCAEDFEFRKVLGKGSFGKVMLAKLKDTEYYYAVKCLKKDEIIEDNDIECTLIERKVLALGTKHPFLCHLLCTFQTESHLFFVMEYLNGGDLMFHITTTGYFSEDYARFYSAEVISGLQFLHSKGIIYRDLKLDNVMLDFDGHVRLADFGMCKLQIFLDRMAESFCGTPDYMAPEIIKGLHYNQSVDWWSFGVLLYEMLSGQSPFSGCDEDELFWSICNEKPVFPKHFSTNAVEILKLLLEKDQSKRLGNRFCEHGSIRDHAFFKNIDWSDLEARRIEPPFKPHLVHPLDTQYFDAHFTKETVKLTTGEEPAQERIDQTQFRGFSYTNPNACDR
ncbi:unnamed protein product [Phyllotreta striolata]|uniref:protein kinase C n=1 Tax=Phyllotreta striolata TaxID=444603 RepID=A0A9N9TFH9_PHYSR|nr:unnamed protein product [Phyllotreta striolata]